MDWLQSLKENNFVNRIGVSIYDPSDLDSIPLDRLDIVQLPLSLYDQRFLKNGVIDYLGKQGLDIHVRSIFLQGLILQNAEKWPKFLSSDFKSHHLRFYKELKLLNINPLEASLNFIKNCDGIEAALIGVTNSSELNAISKVWNSQNNNFIDAFKDGNYNLSWDHSNEIDPRTWPSK